MATVWGLKDNNARHFCVLKAVTRLCGVGKVENIGVASITRGERLFYWTFTYRSIPLTNIVIHYCFSLRGWICNVVLLSIDSDYPYT